MKCQKKQQPNAANSVSLPFQSWRAGQAALSLPWRSEPLARSLCSVPHNKHRAETILVSRASKQDKEEGTKDLLGILLCHRHKKIVGPVLTKKREKKEWKQETRKGQERAVVAFSLGGADPAITLQSNATS